MDAPATENVRLFIAITPATELAEKLKDAQSRLRSRLSGDAVRWVKPEQLHLTLKFLGKVSRGKLDSLVAATNCACGGIKSFRLSLERVGCFPNTKVPRVIWIGIGGELESLKTLQNRIESETGRFGECDELREFHPHLTIGRVRAHGRTAHQVGKFIGRASVPPLDGWIVRRVELVQSEPTPEGARYRTLTSIILADR